MCVTNTNRQLHAVAETVLGQPKAEAARVRAINPACRGGAAMVLRRDEEARPFDETFDFVWTAWTA
ncbi:MAG: hypothetical protein M9910_08740 [Kiritimatiellae bacterium]|nr:hypothetical protein [Kiritimatiellia bacterium]